MCMSNNIKDNYTVHVCLIRKGLNMDTLHWDATLLPLRDNAIDVFITDLVRFVCV